MNQASASEIFGSFRVRRERWQIAGTQLDLSWPADMDDLLERPKTHRRHQADGYMPYWGVPWPVSRILAEYVLTGPTGEGRAALELGCGVGIVGLAAAKMGWSVTVSDYDQDALAFARLNAERNQLTLAGAVCIDYCRNAPTRQYPLILGADLLYERRYTPALARWIAAALAPGGTALIADPHRSAADEFPAQAQAQKLHVEQLDREISAQNGMLSRGRIWRLTVD